MFICSTQCPNNLTCKQAFACSKKIHKRNALENYYYEGMGHVKRRGRGVRKIDFYFQGGRDRLPRSFNNLCRSGPVMMLTLS